MTDHNSSSMDIGPDRRAESRAVVKESVRMIVLGRDGMPLVERHCTTINRSGQGALIMTPGTLEIGSRVIMAWKGQVEVESWHAQVVHVQFRFDENRVLGIQKLVMPESIKNSPWFAVFRAAA